MNIVIAGFGAVGKAVEYALRSTYENSNTGISVYIDDPYLGEDLVLPDNIKADAVVVCVATPQNDDGSCYTKNVKDVCDKYRGAKFLIKSAVDPVWLKSFEFEVEVHGGSLTVSPEFLRGTTGADPTRDFLHQEFAIYGGADCRFWHELFKPALPYLEEVRFLTLDQAGFAKYLENSFLAMKVTFFNEMYQIYDSIAFEGFDAMIEAITLDKRIGMSHTQVPGPDGKFGYGGHCFPKDTSALRFIAVHEGDYEPLMMNQMHECNEYFRGMDDSNVNIQPMFNTEDYIDGFKDTDNLRGN